jgi:hypothetical protein
VQTVHVQYQFGGYLPPLTAGKQIRGERIIPVALNLAYADGRPVRDATVRLIISKLDASGQKTPVAVSGAGRHFSGNTFRFIGRHYQFPLSTRQLQTGTYLIEATPDDESGSHSISIRYEEKRHKHSRDHQQRDSEEEYEGRSNGHERSRNQHDRDRAHEGDNKRDKHGRADEGPRDKHSIHRSRG